jgi:Protein of unknown function (DUF3108)
MPFDVERRCHTLCKALVVSVCALIGAGAGAAETPVNMKAHYAIYMTRVRVGEITWAVYFADRTYLASANGKASGVFSVLINGEGSMTTHGATTSGQLVPTSVSSSVTDDEGHSEIEMIFENGVLTHVDDRGAPPSPGRVQVTPELLRRVTDPLSAMLIPVGGDAFAHANCDKTLRIYDGRRRYNLALSFKRIDTMKIESGYAGRVLVCGVVLRALAGYDPDSLLVRYLAGKTDLELWFAPVGDLAIIAPVRALMPTLIGTLEFRATELKPAAPNDKNGSAAPH